MASGFIGSAVLYESLVRMAVHNLAHNLEMTKPIHTPYDTKRYTYN